MKADKLHTYGKYLKVEVEGHGVVPNFDGVVTGSQDVSTTTSEGDG